MHVGPAGRQKNNYVT